MGGKTGGTGGFGQSMSAEQADTANQTRRQNMFTTVGGYGGPPGMLGGAFSPIGKKPVTPTPVQRPTTSSTLSQQGTVTTSATPTPRQRPPVGSNYPSGVGPGLGPSVPAGYPSNIGPPGSPGGPPYGLTPMELAQWLKLHAADRAYGSTSGG